MPFCMFIYTEVDFTKIIGLWTKIKKENSFYESVFRYIAIVTIKTFWILCPLLFFFVQQVVEELKALIVSHMSVDDSICYW